MKKEDILKQLEKEKEPLKYLQKILKEIKDKDLQKEIQKLIEKYTKKKEKPLKSIEDTVQGPSIRSPQVQTETLEDYHPRTSRRIISTSGPNLGDTEEPKPEESYGSNVKGDYINTSKEFQDSLETKGLVSRTGFTGTAETQETIKKESGNNRDYQNQGETLEDYSVRDTHMDQDAIGRSSDLREMHKKKKNIEVYHG
jgi:hypothetical protein|tara:strand:- start:165 stop:758 length:594 start_codon:yes stop_codon:yes gene_type:complete